MLGRCCSLAQRSLPATLPALRTIQTEPPYLDSEGAEVPTYELVNVQLRGHDFTVVEHYAKWVHHTATNMGLDVEDCWATPCKKLSIQTLKPQSNKVEAEYQLQVYERSIQLADLSSVAAGLFLEVVQAGLPQGVEMAVQEHMPEHTEIRYVPDLELRDLYQKLNELGGPSKK